MRVYAWSERAEDARSDRSLSLQPGNNCEYKESNLLILNTLHYIVDHTKNNLIS